MYTPQAGIFALGTASHAYLELDLLDAKQCKAFASTIAAIREPRTTTGGVNFVIGFRPELWRNIVPDDAPAGVEGFNKEIRGTEGFVMPSTQHDALVWLSGSAYDVVFDMARSVVHDLAGTKPDSIELENKPSDSHVARTDQDEFGHIFRRNMPYGTVADHGTMFVGFSADQRRLSRMLDSMAGLVTGTRDALTRFTEPLTGSYYFVPSVETLRHLRGDPKPS